MIHALKADRAGNVLIEGIVGVQKEAVLAAKRSLVTVEEIVEDFGERSANAVILPSWTVGAIACVPGGAHPSYAHGYYKRDNAFYKAWDAISRDRDAFLAWMKANVLEQRAGGFRRAYARGSMPPRSEARHELQRQRDDDRSRRRARCSNSDVCFVGIGMPSAACNLARLTHAPDITLIYESGTIATKPDVLPLSIGDGELCDTALTTVPVPEMFRYWLQGGRITVGFLGGAQIDRFANLNTTVVGPYDKPKMRLPGGGGAPEIAIACGEIFIIMRQAPRSFVEKLDFVTSFGHGEGGDHRARLGITTKGPTKLITDLAIFEPDPVSKEMTVTSIHPGVTREQIAANTGWPVRLCGAGRARRRRRPHHELRCCASCTPALRARTARQREGAT